MVTLWGTASEKAFIDELGTHTKQVVNDPSYRLCLLQGYKKGIALRQVWDSIDQFEIIDYVNDAITLHIRQGHKESK